MHASWETAGGSARPMETARFPAAGRASAFAPFGLEALAEARRRGLPLFLVIGEIPAAIGDPALRAHLSERALPVALAEGERPDVEALCQRAAMRLSGEGALPLCALLLPNGLPFLAAPLPPHDHPLDAARLFVWLTQADRRLCQNPQSAAQIAADVLRSFREEPNEALCSPERAGQALRRALNAVEDREHGGFGGTKAPFVCALRFLSHAAARGDADAHAMLSRAMKAMLSSPLYDPLDGLFFRAALTDDWRVVTPEKPLGVNALLALTLEDEGMRSEAVRLLDALSLFALPSGGLSPALHGARSTYAFRPEQLCALLGGEDGLRASRLLSLEHRNAPQAQAIAPSRFSPPPPERMDRLSDRPEPLFPALQRDASPEDVAFLHRVLPIMLRARAARPPQIALPHVVTEASALAAYALAAEGKRLGEARYGRMAGEICRFLLSLPPAPDGAAGLPPAFFPVSPLNAQAGCGASAAIALALLTLGGEDAAQGLRLLNAAIQAFISPDGLPMITPDIPGQPTPRLPAIYDSELPSPAATLTRALRSAEQRAPGKGYGQLAAQIWRACSPFVMEQPLACAALIDANVH